MRGTWCSSAKDVDTVDPVSRRAFTILSSSPKYKIIATIGKGPHFGMGSSLED